MWLFVKNLLFTVVVPGTVAGFVPYFAFDHAPLTLGFGSLLGGMLMTLGSILYCWCVWDFATRGRGTPAPIDPPKALVVSGPYRYVRNPMYVAVLTVIMGWAMLFASFSLAMYGAVVAVFFQLFVLGYEEPHLKDEFGEQYATYRTRVGRWWPTRRFFDETGDKP